MSDENDTEEYIGEDGKKHLRFKRDEVTATSKEGEAKIGITVIGQGIEQEKERLWLEMKDAIADKYNELGIENFDIDSIKSVEDMNYHREILNKLEAKQKPSMEKKEPQGGVPLTSSQLGDNHSFPIDYEDFPIDLIPFESEDEAFEFLRKTAFSESSNPERKLEAQRLLNQLVRQHARQGGTYELEGSLKEALQKRKRRFRKVNG